MACPSAGRAEVLDLDWPAPDRWTAEQASIFAARLCALTKRPGLAAIILTGERLFTVARSPSDRAPGAALDPILRQIAESPVPIVAAIAGSATDAGLELALACAARVGVAGASFALTGVHAARLPELTTLRRLPTLIGVEAAASMVALGRPLDAGRARRVGLIDALAEDGLLEAAGALALALALALPERPDAAQPDLAADGQAQFFLVRRMLKRDASRQAAPLAAVRAMEAAVQSPSRRAAAEVGTVAGELARSDQGRALRHADAARQGARGILEGDAGSATRLAAGLRWPMMREAIHLLDEGATPAQVDRVLTDYGFGRGPFAEADAKGLGAVFSTDGETLASGEAWLWYSPTLDMMVDGGRTGGAAAGWYRPDTGAASRFDPDLERLIHRSAVSQRLHRKPLPDEVVLSRCLDAAVNAAYGTVERDPGLTLDEVDGVWTSLLGFPAWRGGPCYDAAVRGLSEVVNGLAACVRRRDTGGAPCALLAAAAADQDSAAVASSTARR